MFPIFLQLFPKPQCMCDVKEEYYLSVHIFIYMILRDKNNLFTILNV